jgi:NTP pyrophosphatase (non-canonical NTP hydrolase)
MKLLEFFLKSLKLHAKRKSKLYDGVNTNMPIDTALRYAAEELGEVATAISRDRYHSALDECVDLAHCAFLIYKSISEQKGIER